MAEPARRKDPDEREYQAPSLPSFTEWDKVGQIRGVLRSLEDGQFADAALLCTLMLRDDRIYGCSRIRFDGLAGIPIEWDPAQIRGRVTAKTQKISDDCEARWPGIVSPAALSQLVSWGRFIGIGVGEWAWEDATAEGEAAPVWTLRLKVWHPQFLEWDWTKRVYRLQTDGLEGDPTSDRYIELPRTDRDVHSDGRWVLYTPYGYEHAWYYGLVRTLAMPYLRRTWDTRDQARYNEIYGLMIRQIITPGTASSDAKTRLRNAVANMGSGGVVETPQTATEKWDVAIKSPGTPGHEVFISSLDRIDRCIGNAILGQGASGKTGASLGNSVEQQDESVRDDLRRADAGVYAVLREQGLWWWALHNYGDGSLAPTPRAALDPAEDETAKATARQTTIAAAEMAQRVPDVDVRQLLEDGGIPLVEITAGEEEDIGVPDLDITPSDVATVVKVNEVRASRALGPLLTPAGARDPDGDLTVAEFKAKRAAVIAAGVAAAEGQTTPQQESAPDATAEAATLSALGGGASLGLVLLRAAGTKPRRFRPKTAADRTAQRAMRAAQPQVAAEVEAVLSEVRAAASPDDLKARLLKRFADQDPAALAAVVEKAMLLADLEGRWDVTEGL